MSKIFLFYHLIYVFKLQSWVLLKIKAKSGSVYKYVNINLRFSCEICLDVGGADNKLDFCDIIPNKRN